MPEEQLNYKHKVGGLTIKVRCNKRLEIYRDHLDRIKTALKLIRDNRNAADTAAATFTVANLPGAYQTLLQNRAGKGTNHILVKQAFRKERLKKLLTDLAKELDIWVALGVAMDIRYLHTLNSLNQQQLKIFTYMVNSMDPSLQPAPAYNNYFNQLPRVPLPAAQDNRTAFFHRHPGIQTVLNQIEQYSVANIRQCCERVVSNWDDITKAFFPGKVLINLDKIGLTGSDYHKGGKQVIILTFECKERVDPRVAAGSSIFNVFRSDPKSLERLVYKPSDMDIDCRIMGDKNVFLPPNRVNPQNYRLPVDGSIMEAIQDHLTNAHIAGPPMPTYKILPYHSHSAPGGAPANFRDPYGYIEYLKFGPKPPEVPTANELNVMQGHVQSFVRKHGRHASDNSDYILWNNGNRTVANYFRSLGRLMAVCATFSITDMHFENVRVRKGVLHLIDVEDCFKWPMKGVKNTGLIGLSSPYTLLDDVARGALELVLNNDRAPQITPAWDNRYSNDWLPFQAWEMRGNHPGPYTIHKVGQQQARNHIADICMGLAEVMEVIQRNADTYQNLVGNMNNTYARFVPVATAKYYTRAVAWHTYPRGNHVRSLIDCPHGLACNACLPGQLGKMPPLPIDEAMLLESRHAYTRDNENAHRIENFDTANVAATFDEWYTHAHFLLASTPNDYADYGNFDIPCYYHQLGSQHLVNSQGQQVNIANCRGDQTNRGAPARGYNPTNWDLHTDVIDKNHNTQQKCDDFRDQVLQALTNNAAYFPDTAQNMVDQHLQWLSTRANFRTRMQGLLQDVVNTVYPQSPNFNFAVPIAGGQNYVYTAGPPPAWTIP